MSLTSLDVSKWNTGKCEIMKNMFLNCPALTTIDVSNWDTQKVTDMYCMFSGCNALTKLETGKWNTSNVTNLGCVCRYCRKLELIDVSGWDTSGVTQMDSAFYQCRILTTLDVSKWDTSKVTTFANIFCECHALKELDLSNWVMQDTANTQFMLRMLACDDDGTQTYNRYHKLEKVSIGTGCVFHGNETDNAVLPTPTSNDITGADGNWYNVNGKSFTPDGIPSRVAETYYASLLIVNEIRNTPAMVKNSHLIDSAYAISEKRGSKARLKPSDFADQIKLVSENTSPD
jgi:surface protein